MTAPLTPPDCDLRDFPAMLVDAARLLQSDTWLTASGDEAKASMSLWLASWSQVPAGSLPRDDKMLSHLSLAASHWPKVRAFALAGWIVCDDGRLYHPVVAEKANEAHARMRRMSKRGLAGALKRWHKDASSIGTSNATSIDARDATSISTSIASSNAQAMLKNAKRREGNKEQPPTTLNGVESSSPPDAQAMPQAMPQASPPLTLPMSSEVAHNGDVSRGTRLPNTWTLPPEWAEFARQDRPDWSDGDILRCSHKFRDYWCARAGADARKTDWRSTWRNWVRRETDKARPGNAHDARMSVARDIIGALGHDDDDTKPGIDPRDISGEAERIS